MAYIFTDSLTQQEVKDNENKLLENNNRLNKKITEKDNESETNKDKFKSDLNSSKEFDKKDELDLTDRTENDSFYNEGELIDIINNFYKPSTTN